MSIIDAAAKLLEKHRHVYDRDCSEDFGCACGHVNEYGDDSEHARHLVEVLTEAGLLSHGDPVISFEDTDHGEQLAIQINEGLNRRGQ